MIQKIRSFFHLLYQFRHVMIIFRKVLPYLQYHNDLRKFSLFYANIYIFVQIFQIRFVWVTNWRYYCDTIRIKIHWNVNDYITIQKRSSRSDPMQIDRVQDPNEVHWWLDLYALQLVDINPNLNVVHRLSCVLISRWRWCAPRKGIIMEMCIFDQFDFIDLCIVCLSWMV